MLQQSGSSPNCVKISKIEWRERNEEKFIELYYHGGCCVCCHLANHLHGYYDIHISEPGRCAPGGVSGDNLAYTCMAA